MQGFVLALLPLPGRPMGREWSGRRPFSPSPLLPFSLSPFLYCSLLQNTRIDAPRAKNEAAKLPLTLLAIGTIAKVDNLDKDKTNGGIERKNNADFLSADAIGPFS